MQFRRPVTWLVAVATAGAALAVAPTVSADTGRSTCSRADLATYRVGAGDSWYGIATRVGVSAGRLLVVNDASADDVLLVGDLVCLPSGATPVTSCPSATYTVDRDDSWYAIAARAGVATSALLAANGASITRTIHPDDVLCLPDGASGSGGSSGSYTVGAGDSWFAISLRAGVSMRALLDANGATATTLLVPGDRLTLPAGSPQLAGGSVRLASAPVRGACWFSDTWLAARSGGRRHMGVDVIAAHGTSVRAVVDGRLTSRVWDIPGRRSGNAWTLTGADGTTYFYAHLLDFAPGFHTGSWVRAGDIIGFVGATGNATFPHLHFEVHPGGGGAVNPYPYLLATGECGRALTG